MLHTSTARVDGKFVTGPSSLLKAEINGIGDDFYLNGNEIIDHGLSD